MSYTVREEGTGEYVEKKSSFIGRIRRVTTEEEARDFIAAIKKQERGARHNVFAYIIAEGDIVRYSDDGEPQGTGGQPVLHVLTANELSDVCLVVTRYFGGVLLGAPGLTRAYSRAASEAAASVKRWQMAKACIFEAELAYDVHARLTSFLEGVQLLETRYEEAVTMTVITEAALEEELKGRLTDLSQGAARLSESRAALCFRREDGFLEEIPG